MVPGSPAGAVAPAGLPNPQQQEAFMPDKDPAPIGHNSDGSVASDELKSIIERVERLAEEKQALQGDISDVFSEAKLKGFDTKVIRAIIKDRKIAAAELAEFNAMKELYEQALGVFA